MDKNEIELRQANENELDIIAKIAYQTWPLAYGNILSPAQLKYMLERFYSEATLKEKMEASSLFFIAGAKGIDLGFLEIGLSEKQDWTKIHKLYVLPEAQGKNIGKILIDKALEIAKAQQQKGLFLNVNRYNKAKTFYEHLGFTIEKTEDIDIGEGYFMNDYVMQLKLG